MRLLFLSLALLLGGCVIPSSAYVSAPPVTMSVDTFGPHLDPYGAWVTVPGYSQQLWQPSPNYVGADFYPYGTGGQWLYTNAGWVFESDYPFGWAVFHYGRWTRHFDYGWLWMPGTAWGPSWVSWRFGGPYIGWAPLGPYGPAGYQYADWCFVPADRFTVYNSRAYTTGPYEFHRAVAATDLPRRNARAGPPPSFIAEARGQPVVPVPVNALHGSAGRSPPPPPPPGSVSLSPMQAPRPPPPMGWREQPGQQLTPPPPRNRSTSPSSQGFSPPPPQNRAAPAPPSQGFNPPPPQYRSAPPAPQNRSAPPPPSSRGFSPPPAPQQRSAPPPSQPSYRSAPPSMSAPPAPPPPSSHRSAPAPAPPPMRAAPPPPPTAPR